MDQYIRYHKKPYANYLDVKAFNKKYGTDIPEVEHYDEYFHATFTQAKQMQGPDDFLLVKFATHDEFEEMGYFSDKIAAAAKAVGNAKKAIGNAMSSAAKAAAKAAKGAFNKLSDTMKSAYKKEVERIVNSPEYKNLPDSDKEEGLRNKMNEWCNQQNSKGKKKIQWPSLKDLKAANLLGDVLSSTSEQPSVDTLIAEKPKLDDLDALLSDDEDILEAEYEETEAPVTNIVTEKKQITDLVKASSSDTKAFEQDMKHLIQFKNAKIPLQDQLMKGRPKYMKALKAYVKGDKKAEVKMSWKEGKNKMVKVASFNPNIKSLRAILRQTPGTLRVVECL